MPASEAIAAAEEIGGVAVLIDAKSDRAREWSERLGAEPLLDNPMSLVITPATFAAAD